MKQKRKKGSLSNLALSVVIAIVSLYVGLFMIQKISGIQPESDLFDLSYVTLSNTTPINLTAGTSNLTFDMSDYTTISGVTPIGDIFVKVHNFNTTTNATITVYFNGTSVGTFTATNNSASNHTFTTVPFFLDASANVTVKSSALLGTLKNNTIYVNQTDVYYPNGKSANNFGLVFNNLSTSTGTIYDVLVLVIIIVSLGVAIVTLRGFSGGEGLSPNAI